jgi:hypothetical protein
VTIVADAGPPDGFPVLVCAGSPGYTNVEELHRDEAMAWLRAGAECARDMSGNR